MLKTEEFFIRNFLTQDNAPSLEYLAMYNIGKLRNTTLQLHEALLEPSVKYDATNKIVHIFLNTNIFDKYSHDKILGYINKIPIKINQYSDRKNIFISGHVPITSKFYKEKGGKVLHYTSLSHDIIIMKHFLDILSSLNPIPIYLCSDTHNFQIMSIRHNNKFITQIVAGTGGAEPDDLKPYMQNMKINYNYIIQNEIDIIDGYYSDSYGYTVIEIKGDIIKVIYKHIIGINNEHINTSYEYIISKDGQIILQSKKLLPNINPFILKDANIEKNKQCVNLSPKYLVKSKKNNDVLCYKKINNSNKK
jgi:hypothetical protein